MKTRLFRQFTSLLLIFAILLSVCASVLAYTCSGWAKPEIDAAAEEGIIPDSLLNENLALSLTRQEMCDIVVHTFEQMTGTTLFPASTSHFKDTTNSNVCIAAELGIVNGRTDGTFGPNDLITRQEIAQIISKFYTTLGWTRDVMDDPGTDPAPEPEPDPDPAPEPEPEPDPDPAPTGPAATDFSDYNSVSLWARGAADLVVSLGIIKGNSHNQLTPQNTTSREEALAMMLRTYKFMMDYLNLPLPTEQSAEATVITDSTDEVIEPAESTDAAPDVIPEEGIPAEDVPQPPAPEQTNSTPTYHCSAWAKAEMAEAVRYGIMPASLLHADLTQKINRAEICYTSVLSFMAITDTAGEPNSTDHFTDTSDPMINLAYELKLVNGTPGGTFLPYDLMTREQLFMIINNLLKAAGWQAPAATAAELPEEAAMELPEETVEPVQVEERAEAVNLNDVFTDAADISAWALPAVQLMYEVGVLKGDSSGRLNPLGNTTREQGILMFMRAYQYILPWYLEHPLTEIKGPVTADQRVLEIVNFAMQFEGYPYVYGEESPEKGFDCSGLIWYVYKQFGINLYRTAATQMKNGIHVEYENLRPGDIIGFWNSARTEIGHVALYIGNGKILHAQSSSTGVCISDVGPDSYYYGRYYEARRIIY